MNSMCINVRKAVYELEQVLNDAEGKSCGSQDFLYALDLVRKGFIDSLVSKLGYDRDEVNKARMGRW